MICDMKEKKDELIYFDFQFTSLSRMKSASVSVQIKLDFFLRVKFACLLVDSQLQAKIFYPNDLQTC